MSFWCSSFSFNVLGVIIAFCVGIITYFKWSYTYWKRKNVPFLSPSSWYGNMENPFARTKSLAIWVKTELYDNFKKKGLKHGGIYIFSSPAYLPLDPDFIKNIMQTDFQYFSDRGVYYNEKCDPLSAGLFFLGGQKWRNMRVKLTPTFTSGKMKMMFDTLLECGKPLKSMMDELTERNNKINIRDVVARYTTDIIGSCAFGLECNSFKSSTTEFRQFGKQILEMSTFWQLLQTICTSQPSIGQFFNIRAFPKSATDFFLKVIQDTINYRKENNIKRKDILQLLMEINTTNNIKSEESSSLTIEEIAAQCLGFFIAGYETSSSTMTYCLYELAKNSKIQQKVRDEINAVLLKHDGQITYDSISDLNFMNQVIEETLRKYPPVPLLPRKCVQDYQIPNTDVVIEKGTAIFISIYGLHHDPDYYENPESFDPERFSEENKNERQPFTYIPFGEGPRLCIGLRFGMMQIKVGLTVLLKNYIFSLNENTPNVLTFNPNNMFLLDSGDTIWLESQPILLK